MVTYIRSIRSLNKNPVFLDTLLARSGLLSLQTLSSPLVVRTVFLVRLGLEPNVECSWPCAVLRVDKLLCLVEVGVALVARP